MNLSNYPAVDVAIGLFVLFFLLSIVCSAVQEFLATLVRLRGRMLERALREMLGTKADDLGANLPVSKPSYIDPKQFSLALLDTLAPEEGQATVLTKAKAEVEKLPNLGAKRQLLRLIDDANNDVAKFRSDVEQWFDASMERVSGWYKRRAQYFLLAIAAAVAIAGNVDTFHVANQLWSDPALRASVVAKSQQIVEAGDQTETAAPDEQGTSAGEEGATETCPSPDATGQEVKECIDKKLDNVATAVDDVEDLKLPIGWTKENRPPESGNLLAKIAGIVITMFALSLGAPFWFDMLGKVTRLRGSGPRPSSSSGGQQSEPATVKVEVEAKPPDRS